jgi:hypothetical protein
MRMAVVAAPLLGLGGCSLADLFSPGDRVCTLEYRMGLTIEVRDAGTGEPAAAGALGVARTGTYEEVLQGGRPGQDDALVLVGLGERPGTYAVEITRAGYETWAVEGVRIRHDDCHVIPVRLVARLQPIE